MWFATQLLFSQSSLPVTLYISSVCVLKGEILHALAGVGSASSSQLTGSISTPCLQKTNAHPAKQLTYGTSMPARARCAPPVSARSHANTLSSPLTIPSVCADSPPPVQAPTRNMPAALDKASLGQIFRDGHPCMCEDPGALKHWAVKLMRTVHKSLALAATGAEQTCILPVRS